ncbi:helix-turn-helix domain-containing protein [Russula earlei]|uniref:Helix-turn-helix domain-containing protein n=1 Tax=Russula earlei TaxID=71964 RepID=A0ACC0TVP4_9AGAM|nr:helix-turn-helix domain-containing protein [Russula earlei]
MVNKKIAQLTLQKFAELYAHHSINADFFITEERQLLTLSEHPYRSGGYIIGICTSGWAQVEVNLQTFEARPGALLMATPFHILRIHSASDDFLCRFLVFSTDFLAEQHNNSLFVESFNFFKTTAVPVIYNDGPGGAVILQMLGFIELALKDEGNSYHAQICQSILTTMLYVIADLYDKHHVIQRTVHFYAEQLFVSSKHLTETVKEVTGKTAGEWIDEAIILEAKVVLHNSGIGVAEVANSLHFPDQSSFGKFFKKHTGYSPSQFRVLPER